MLFGHELVRKELIDGQTTKLSRREANAVDDEKFQCRSGWPLVAVWRGDPPHTFKPSCVGFYLHPIQSPPNQNIVERWY